MDDEKLILLVQANECLYNKYSPGYKLNEKKKNVWKQISKEMQIPEEMCIKRWACLRDRYAREKRQRNLPSGSGAKSESYWPLMDTMDFIAPHIVPRATRCSKNILDEIEPLTSIEISSQSSPLSSQYTVSPLFDEYQSSTQSSTSQLSTSQSSTSQTYQSQFSPISPSPTTATVPKRKRNNPDSDDENSFAGALEAFKKLCEKKIGEKEEEKNPLDGFGKMIVATIQSMNSEKQIKAMQRVTSIVMEMKLEREE